MSSSSGESASRGLSSNKSGITRWLSSFPVPLVLVHDDCSPAPDAKVLAHELGHVLLHSHARSLHYVAGHSTDDRDLMFPTVHADPLSVRITPDEAEVMNP